MSFFSQLGILAALEAEQNNGWLPIASAPKDGSYFLVYDGHSRSLGRWDVTVGWLRQSLLGEPLGPDNFGELTHWMPLPAPPICQSRAP